MDPRELVLKPGGFPRRGPCFCTLVLRVSKVKTYAYLLCGRFLNESISGPFLRTVVADRVERRVFLVGVSRESARREWEGVKRRVLTVFTIRKEPEGRR